jgi:hypothetical protein
VVVDTPKEVSIERRPYEDSLPLPRTTPRHIRAQVHVEQKEKSDGRGKRTRRRN